MASYFPIVTRGTFLPASPQSDGLLFSGARAAALVGISLLGTACSGYEAADTTTLLSITGGAVGAATILLFSRRNKAPVLQAGSQGVETQRPKSDGSIVLNPQGGIDMLTTAIELNPKDAASYNARALAREKMRDHRGAVDDFSRAIELDPKNARLFLRRGSAKFDCGDYHGAVEDHTRALEIDPEYAGAYFHRALAKEELGLLEEARRDYLDAKKKGGHSGIAIFADRGLRDLEKRAGSLTPLEGR